MPPKECEACGDSFEFVQRARNRRICVACRRRELKHQQSYRFGLFRRGERAQEAKEIAKYCGRALFERRLRMARYAESVAKGEPIPFEPRFRVR